jgi:phage terminase large subunit-like protein
MASSFAAQLVEALENSWPAVAAETASATWRLVADLALLAGRGFGKTSTLAEWVCDQAALGQASRIAIVAATAGDVRDVMIEGASGILAVAPPWFRPHYEPSKRRLTWPNGAIATTFSAEEPDRLRIGPIVPTASWRKPTMAATWLQLRFA